MYSTTLTVLLEGNLFVSPFSLNWEKVMLLFVPQLCLIFFDWMIQHKSVTIQIYIEIFVTFNMRYTLNQFLSKYASQGVINRI